MEHRALLRSTDATFESETSPSDPVATGSGHRCGEATSSTISTQIGRRTQISSNIRVYVSIDHLIELFRIGEATTFKVISAIALLLKAIPNFLVREGSVLRVIYGRGWFGSGSLCRREKGESKASSRLLQKSRSARMIRGRTKPRA
jgi:hypothetical protein